MPAGGITLDESALTTRSHVSRSFSADATVLYFSRFTPDCALGPLWQETQYFFTTGATSLSKPSWAGEEDVEAVCADRCRFPDTCAPFAPSANSAAGITIPAARTNNLYE